jgi:hypothetical protein
MRNKLISKILNICDSALSLLPPDAVRHVCTLYNVHLPVKDSKLVGNISFARLVLVPYISDIFLVAIEDDTSRLILRPNTLREHLHLPETF